MRTCIWFVPGILELKELGSWDALLSLTMQTYNCLCLFRCSARESGYLLLSHCLEYDTAISLITDIRCNDFGNRMQ